MPLTSSLSHGVSSVTTGEDGSYQLALGQGSYELVAQKAGYATSVQTVTLAAPGLVNASFTTSELPTWRVWLQSLTDHFQYSL